MADQSYVGSIRCQEGTYELEVTIEDGYFKPGKNCSFNGAQFLTVSKKGTRCIEEMKRRPGEIVWTPLIPAGVNWK